MNKVQAMLYQQYPTVMSGEELKPWSKSVRECLIKEMENFKSIHLQPLKPMAKHDHILVHGKYMELSVLEDKFNAEYMRLRLARIAEDTVLLLKKFPAKTETLRKLLLWDVNQFEARELEFMRTVPNGFTKDLHEIKSRITQIHLKKSGLEIPFPAKAPKGPDTNFNNEMTRVMKAFFSSSPNGIFDNYLKERAKTFWVGDMFCKFAALTFGCMGYKSPVEERQRFINWRLKPAMLKYQSSKDKNTQAYRDLMKLINEGQKKFKSRAKKGHSGYSQSLFAKLELLKREVVRIEAVREAAEVLDAEVGNGVEGMFFGR